MSASRCDRCGETVADIDAGFSPGVHEMRHVDCGGTWRVVERCDDESLTPGAEREILARMASDEPGIPHDEAMRRVFGEEL